MIPNVVRDASGGKVQAMHVDFQRSRITVMSNLPDAELSALQAEVRKRLADGREWEIKRGE